MVSAVGDKPLTEARETSAMSNTRSVPAKRTSFKSNSYVNIVAFSRIKTRGPASNIATAVAV
jgi:hypothetical protein